ncbi:MAG TPA: response regulator [Aggregatilineales bacterium]|nr:response regulator [Aggregatilineales bacterium]
MIILKDGHALVIDDEPANRDFVERLLQTAGFKVSGAGTGADGLKAARGFPQLALALVDQELPDATGLDIIKTLRQENPESIIVMATMHDDRTLIEEAFDAGVDVFLVKPHGFMELYRRLQEADSDAALVRRLIIDQYGPRPYRGTERKVTPEVRQPSHEEVTRPTPAVQPVAAPAPVTPSVSPTPTTPTVAPAPVQPASKPISPSLAPAASTPLSKPDVPKGVENKPATTTNVGEKEVTAPDPGQNTDKKASLQTSTGASPAVSAAVDTSVHRPVSPTDKTLARRPDHKLHLP